MCVLGEVGGCHDDVRMSVVSASDCHVRLGGRCDDTDSKQPSLQRDKYGCIYTELGKRILLVQFTAGMR